MFKNLKLINSNNLLTVLSKVFFVNTRTVSLTEKKEEEKQKKERWQHVIRPRHVTHLPGRQPGPEEAGRLF